MTNFIIINISANQVTYNGTIINPGISYPVTSSHINYILDGCFLSDLAMGNCIANVCGTNLSGSEAVRFMTAWALGNGIAKYNASLPSLVDTQYSGPGLNQFGEMSVQFRNKYINLTGEGTTVVKSGSGRLHSIMVNRNWTGGRMVIHDSIDGNGIIIATIDFGTPSGGLLSSTGVPGPVMIGPLGLEFSTGLTVVTSGSPSNDITILYQ